MDESGNGRFVAALFAWLVIALASLTVIGYIFRDTVGTRWEISPGMSWNTALCLAFLAVALLNCCRKH